MTPDARSPPAYSPPQPPYNPHEPKSLAGQLYAIRREAVGGVKNTLWRPVLVVRGLAARIAFALSWLWLKPPMRVLGFGTWLVYGAEREKTVTRLSHCIKRLIAVQADSDLERAFSAHPRRPPSRKRYIASQAVRKAYNEMTTGLIDIGQ